MNLWILETTIKILKMKKYKCDCGGTIEEGRCLVEDFLVSCMKCNKCEEHLFTSEQTKELIRLRDANKEIVK